MKTKWFLLMMFLAAGGLLMARQIPLINADFATPTVKVSTGFDSTPDIPGWHSGVMADSGVEAGHAYIQAADASFWQSSTDTVVKTAYTLSFQSQLTYSGNSAGIIQATVYYGDAAGTIRTPIKTQSWTKAYGAYATHTMVVDPCDIPSAAAGQYIGVEFDNTNPVTNCWISLDNVSLSTTDIATNPSPANNQLNVIPASVTLQWTMPAGSICDLYFGTISEPNLINTPANKKLTLSSNSSWAAGTLAYDTTYYWRVDVYEPNLPSGYKNVVTGSLWKFTTAGLAPVIITDPWPVVTTLGSSPTFTVTTVNAVTHAWYKKGNATPLANGADYTIVTGAGTSSLTVNNVSLADEGAYYCRITDGLTQSDESTKAVLVTRRLVANWKFENNLNDEGGAYPGTSADAAYGTGIGGGFAKSFTIGQDLVTIQNSAEMFNFYPVSFTVSAWVNLGTNTTWGGIVGYRTPAPAYRGFTLARDGQGGPNSQGLALINIRPFGTPPMESPAGDLYAENVDGNLLNGSVWKLVTATYDSATMLTKLYVNGVLVKTSGTFPYNPPYDGNVNPMVIGGWGSQTDDTIPVAATASITGLVDDVRIYSYALSAVDVAHLYIDQNPTVTICTENPTFDIVDSAGLPGQDCRVDLKDFAAIAGEWLECNIVPTCL